MSILKHNKVGLILLALSMILMAAGDSYRETKVLELQGDFIRSDELGNVFVVKDNKLTKFNSSGEQLHTYSNVSYGDITHIDIHDPFKVLLYYQPFGQVEFLDHTLSLTSSTIDLNSLYIGLPTLVCASYQGAFWVYNPNNFELIRVNQSLEISEQSGNLQQVTGYSINPNYLIERDNFIYINDPEIGILIFDKYGSYYKTIPVKGLLSFQVFNNKIIYFIGDEISIYDTRLNELSATALPWEDALSVSVCLSLEPQRLYMMGPKKLFFYEIQ
jgi:hypothetical protein